MASLVNKVRSFINKFKLIKEGKEETDELVEFSVHGKLLTVSILVIDFSIQESL